MENTPRLYDTLVHVLSQHTAWSDQRHLKTLAWIIEFISIKSSAAMGSNAPGSCAGHTA